MLITESQMGFYNKNIDSLTLLDNMNYLTEAESVFSPAMVPIVENTSVGAHLIRLEDIMTFAESNGIEDLGYALSTVCEASEVDPSTIVFTVNEENVIADDSLADLVTGIMNEGVGVIAKPLNENNPMGILTNYAVNSLLETGDSTALELLCEDFETYAIAQMMLEASYYDATNDPDKENMDKFEGWLKKNYKGSQLTAARQNIKRLQQAGISNEHIRMVDLGNQDQVFEMINTYGKQNGKRRTSDKKVDNYTQNLRKEIAGRAQQQQQTLQNLQNRAKIQADTAIDKAERKEADKTRKAAAQYKKQMGGLADYDGKYDNAPSSNPNDEKGKTPAGAPATPQQAESFLDKIKKYANKGRDAIAAVIAKINSWIRSIEADPNKTGVWNTIVGRLKQALNWLTAKMHNIVASDNREKLNSSL